MSLIVTPRDLERRANLYHQFSQLLNAGIGLIQALQIQYRSPPSPAYRVPLSKLITALEQGSTFTQALETVRGWVPVFDAALLQAGELSGRIPACFTLLAKFYEQRATLVRSMISDLTYPLFLFHFAILIGPFPDLVLTGNVAGYLRNTLSIFFPLYLGVFLLLTALQSRRGERWRATVDQILARIPLLGEARRNLALARLCAALEALISAGVNIVEAWPLAAAASGSPMLMHEVATWRPALNSGQTPADILAHSRKFPELFANMYRTGEVSGRLDETLLRLHVLYLEEGSRRLKGLARGFTQFIYLGIAGMIAYRVVMFYVGYFARLGAITM